MYAYLPWVVRWDMVFPQNIHRLKEWTLMGHSRGGRLISGGI